jgi:hypothetical protein
LGLLSFADRAAGISNQGLVDLMRSRGAYPPHLIDEGDLRPSLQRIDPRRRIGPPKRDHPRQRYITKVGAASFAMIRAKSLIKSCETPDSFAHGRPYGLLSVFKDLRRTEIFRRRVLDEYSSSTIGELEAAVTGRTKFAECDA